MTTHPADHFAGGYAEARRRFLGAAERRGARVAARPIAERGVAGEELAIDTAYLGPALPERLLVVSSGVHGVEGFAGSAVQHRLWSEQLDGLPLPADTGLLCVHAVNPFGFAHLRRVNESNVDLNRNFLRHPEEHVPNPDYESLFEAINPASLDEQSEAASRERLLAFATARGFPQLQQALTCGQYAHPRGVQFGGVREEASNRAMREIVRRETRGARQIAWIDVHTGLGPYGVPEMITELAPEHPATLRGRAWYGDVVKSTLAGESVSAPLHGVMEQGLEHELADDCELTFFAAEFGTYEPTRVFWAMRADNWLHQHGEPGSEPARAIQDELLEVFRPADPAWQRSVLDGAARLIQQAYDGLAAQAAAAKRDR